MDRVFLRNSQIGLISIFGSIIVASVDWLFEIDFKVVAPIHELL